jgi:hypothetical protein
MANLTVSEKNHWRDRIAAKIDRRIEAITASEPGLLDRVKREARARALDSLGLTEFEDELDQIAKEREALEKREQHARRTSLARIRAVDVEDVEIRYYGCRDPEVDAAIKRRQAIHEDEMLAAHEVGRQMLRLRVEKDRLVDVVWLATSPTHVRELWRRVGKLLGDEPTELEHEALSIPSVDEEA